MAQQVLGQMADSGSSLVLEGNALKTQDSIIALSNITRIQCVDDTIPHKLNVALLVILVIVGAGLITAGEVISILLGLACFGGVAYLIYDHTQKQKQRTYALVIELSAGTREAFHSDDLNFLNGVKARIFEAVQNGSARTAYYFDMSNKVIIAIQINSGTKGGDCGWYRTRRRTQACWRKSRTTTTSCANRSAELVLIFVWIAIMKMAL